MGVGGRRTGQRSDPTEPASAGTAAPKRGELDTTNWPDWHCTTSFSACVRWALADMELQVPNSEVLLGLPKGSGCPEDREQLQVGGLRLLWTVDREVHCFALLCFAWVPLPLMLGALSTAAVPLATACIPITSRSPIPIVAFPKTSFYICAKERQRAT